MSITHEGTIGQKIKLIASNFKRSNYGFAGWSFDSNAANDLDNATIYGPNSSITITNIDSPGEIKTLYAVWIETESNVTMQTFDSTAEPYVSAPNGTVIALTDSRDNDTYAVAKLADSKWWMIENLRLGSNTSISLTTSDTAISNGINLDSSTTSFNGGSTDIKLNASNKLSPANPIVDSTSNIYTYGNYYTWAAAIASSYSYTSTTALTSICSYGWHLPTGGSSSEIVNLKTQLSNLAASMNSNITPTDAEMSEIFRGFPNNFVYAGYRYNSNQASKGTQGYYWTATSRASTYAYYMIISDSFVLPNNVNNTNAKYYGHSIRCIAD